MSVVASEAKRDCFVTAFLATTFITEMNKLTVVFIVLLALSLIVIVSGCGGKAEKDSDGDGWSDAQEQNAGTNLDLVDTDGDGYWDAQDANPLDPYIKSGVNTASPTLESASGTPTPVKSNPNNTGTTMHYVVDSISPQFSVEEVDYPFDVRVTEYDAIPSDRSCVTDSGSAYNETESVQQVPNYRWDVITSSGMDIQAMPLRVMSMLGQKLPVRLQNNTIWKSMYDLSEMYAIYRTDPPVPGTSARWEMYAGNYTGIQTGWWYELTAGSSWSYEWAYAGDVMWPNIHAGCTSPVRYLVNAHVVGTVRITVPAGTFDCIEIDETYTLLNGSSETLDQVPLDGSRKTWWTPDLSSAGGTGGGMVKQINVNTPFIGTETWELASISNP